MHRFLAIDLGAESGRGILGTFDGGRLSLSELGRFVTNRGEADRGPDGVHRWDWKRIVAEVRALVASALEAAGGKLDGIGVDSWGVDFGLLDEDGRLLGDPVKYRDASHVAAMQRVHETLPRDVIWEATGIQFLPFNSLYQLAALNARDPGILDRAARMLLVPDLLHHELCGATCGEVSNASTTQMMDPRSRAWRPDLLEALGLPSHFLPDLVEAGQRVGTTPEGIPVYAPATHDTASGVAACPVAPGKRWAFLSSGTWSLVGVERDTPELSVTARDLGLSNELGAGGKVTLLTNIMGLWLVQECRRSLLKETGREYTYSELTRMAAGAPAGGPVVDVRSHRFLAPADMPAEIRRACEETGQTPPDDIPGLIRCCLDSLATSYRQVIAALEDIEGHGIDVLHIVGGGSRNRFLNHLTANECGIPVVAGPAEATAVGNVLAQMVGSGAVSGWEEARDIARRSFDVEVFESGGGYGPDFAGE
jgi:rhamnulokinase